MKFKKTLAALAVQLFLAGGACAQTCTASAGPLNDIGPTVIDTCSSTDQLASICNSSTPIGNAPDTIYSINLPAGVTPRLEISSPAYDVYVALLQGTCSGGSTCARESDNPGVGAIGLETITFVGLTPGTYFLLITSFAASGNCGSTTIVPFPTPVTLQSFSIS